MGLTIKLKKLGNKGKQKLFVIPYFFTFAGAVFGFFSVIKTFEGNFIAAAYCIMIAGILDGFDGRLARLLGSSSFLGMELDSLCDAVSFCFAPVILLYSWYFHTLGFIGVFILALYLCCGLLRLAKFNIASFGGKQNKNQRFFVGLPTTLAAFLIAQLVINYEWLSVYIFPFIKHPAGISLFVAILALLMISPVRFLSFKKINPYVSIFGGLVFTILFAMSIWQGFPFFFFVLFSYVLSCIFYYACVNVCVAE